MVPNQKVHKSVSFLRGSLVNDALQTLIQGLEEDDSLLQVDQLHRRLGVLDVLDVLDAHFVESPDCIGRDADGAMALCRRARHLSARLEALNATLYADIRSEIVRGEGAAALLRWVPSNDAGEDTREPVRGMGYDALDELIRGIFPFEEPSSPPVSIHPEMVFYQPTPVRHIFRLLELTALNADDVLVDLGSGMGHVPLLVALCTSARSVGIELEASYVACARQCARQMHLRGVSFLQQDARKADLSTGTFFYLHTPFTGSILRTVLDSLRYEAARRAIRICTYGPCTTVVAKERWLRSVTPKETDQIAIFTPRV